METYIEVMLTVEHRFEEAAESALLDLGAVGTSSEPVGRRSPERSPEVRVSGYFLQGPAPNAARVAERFAAFRAAAAHAQAGNAGDGADGVNPVDEASLALDIRVRPWRNWAAESRRAFRAFDPVPGLTVAPPWDRPRRPQGDLLVLNPGAAFGLGTHATTRACLALLPPPSPAATSARVLDIGCGSAILALRAAQLGYASIVACEIDPCAARTAAENIALNRLQARVHLFAGTVAALRPGARFALVLANLHLEALRSLAPRLPRLLRPHGTLIASGVLRRDRGELLALLRPHGLEPSEERMEEEWTTLRLHRSGPNDP